MYKDPHIVDPTRVTRRLEPSHSISQLSALRELDMGAPSLPGLPPGMTACQQLSWLSMGSDRSCPQLACLQSMRFLRVSAVLGQNATYRTQLTALTELEVKCNQGAIIHHALGGMSSLRKLRLACSGPLQLPAGSMLSHLESLCLNIPASLSAATQLRELCVIIPNDKDGTMTESAVLCALPALESLSIK